MNSGKCISGLEEHAINLFLRFHLNFHNGLQATCKPPHLNSEATFVVVTKWKRICQKEPLSQFAALEPREGKEEKYPSGTMVTFVKLQADTLLTKRHMFEQ